MAGLDSKDAARFADKNENDPPELKTLPPTDKGHTEPPSGPQLRSRPETRTEPRGAPNPEQVGPEVEVRGGELVGRAFAL